MIEVERLYRDAIARLRQILGDSKRVTEAREALRQYIGKVRCVPAESRGYLIAELGAEGMPLLKANGDMNTLVAGARFALFLRFQYASASGSFGYD